jgi:hypothetical protein
VIDQGDTGFTAISAGNQLGLASSSSLVNWQQQHSLDPTATICHTHHHMLVESGLALGN